MSDTPKHDPWFSIHKGKTDPRSYSVPGSMGNPILHSETNKDDVVSIYASPERDISRLEQAKIAQARAEYWQINSAKIREALHQDFSALHKKIDDNEIKDQERFKLLAASLEEIKLKLKI